MNSALRLVCLVDHFRDRVGDSSDLSCTADGHLLLINEVDESRTVLVGHSFVFLCHRYVKYSAVYILFL